MKKRKFFRLLFAAVLIPVTILLFVILIPRKYPVPGMKERPNISYWQLTTGSRIAYTRIQGRGAQLKPYPIVFVQGGPGGYISQRTISFFDRLADDGYSIYLYDQVGSGHSGRLDDIRAYTAQRHVRDLDAIIGQIGTGKVILIGQSWGAILATLLVAEHASVVERLILTGPGPLIPIRKDLAAIQPPDSLHLKQPLFSNRQANERVSNIRMRTTALWAQICGRKLCPDAEADNFQTLLDGELAKAVVFDTSRAPAAEGGGGYYVQLMTVLSFPHMPDPRPGLKDTDIPLLIMRGQYDNQKWGFVTEYLSLFKNHKLVIIPGAGHSISLEQPDRYISTVREFLDY